MSTYRRYPGSALSTVNCALDSEAGFSLVEVMVASVIMVLATTVAVSLFNYTSLNARRTEAKQDEQSAISEDIAAVIRLNEQYRCTGPATCGSMNDYPNEDEYITANAADIQGICDGAGNGSGFGSLLAAEVNALALPAQATNLNITRTAAEASEQRAPEHLYTVTWQNSDGNQIRQLTLLPTIASWCP
jgi:prepilin-type N-terminal cleavage/methylation domain-containing protein